MLTHQDRSDTSEQPLNTSHLDKPVKALQIQVRNRVLRKRVLAGYYGQGAEYLGADGRGHAAVPAV